MRLHYREFGQGRPLMILHGLFGSSRNWQSLARSLAANYRVITPDLRNHGQSPHADSMPYQAMAADISALARRLRLKDTLLLGHSMGGKVAMSAMLTEPDRFKACVIADIAPVSYAHDFSALAEAMHRLPLAGLKDRNMAEARLAATIDNAALRSVILQNLVRAGDGWRWRINLAGIRSQLAALRGFPPALAGQSSAAPSLFIGGAESDYAIDRDRAAILRHFPNAQIKMIAGAGHWLHADQPAEFLRELSAFLEFVWTNE